MKNCPTCTGPLTLPVAFAIAVSVAVSTRHALGGLIIFIATMAFILWYMRKD